MPPGLTHISSLLVPSSPSPPSSLRRPSSSLSSPSSSSSAIVTTTTTLPTRTMKLPFHTPCAYSLPTFLPQMPPERHQRNNRQAVSTNRSSEFLYLGALVNYTVDPEQVILSSNGRSKLGDPSSPYQKLGSPKLNPLPPMPEVQTLQSVEQFLQYEQMGSFENDVKEKNTYQTRNIEKNSWKNQEIHVNNPSKFK
ncbi:hypothetical protein Gotur_002596 [Gossypium turneri]